MPSSTISHILGGKQHRRGRRSSSPYSVASTTTATTSHQQNNNERRGAARPTSVAAAATTAATAPLPEQQKQNPSSTNQTKPTGRRRSRNRFERYHQYYLSQRQNEPGEQDKDRLQQLRQQRQQQQTVHGNGINSSSESSLNGDTTATTHTRHSTASRHHDHETTPTNSVASQHMEGVPLAPPPLINPIQHIEQQTTYESIEPVMLLGVCALSGIMNWVETKQRIETIQSSPIFQHIMKYHQERDVQYQTYVEYNAQKHRQVKEKFVRCRDRAKEEIQKYEKALAAATAAASKSKSTTSQRTTAGPHHQQQQHHHHHRTKNHNPTDRHSSTARSNDSHHDASSNLVTPFVGRGDSTSRKAPPPQQQQQQQLHEQLEHTSTPAAAAAAAASESSGRKQNISKSSPAEKRHAMEIDQVDHTSTTAQQPTSTNDRQDDHQEEDIQDDSQHTDVEETKDDQTEEFTSDQHNFDIQQPQHDVHKEDEIRDMNHQLDEENCDVSGFADQDRHVSAAKHHEDEEVVEPSIHDEAPKDKEDEANIFSKKQSPDDVQNRENHEGIVTTQDVMPKEADKDVEDDCFEDMENVLTDGHSHGRKSKNDPSHDDRKHQLEELQEEQLLGSDLLPNRLPSTSGSMKNQPLQGQDDGVAQNRCHRMESDVQDNQLGKDPPQQDGVPPPDHFIPINPQKDIANQYVEEGLEEIGEGEMEEEYEELCPRQLPSESMPTTICFFVQDQKAEPQAAKTVLPRENVGTDDGDDRPLRQVINERPERPSHPPPPEEEEPIDTSEREKMTADGDNESKGNDSGLKSDEKSYKDVPDDSSATVMLTQSKNVFHKSARAQKPTTFASSGANNQVERSSAFHPIVPLKRRVNHDSDVFQDARQFQQPQSKSLTKPIQQLSNAPETKEQDRSAQVYRPRPKRPYQSVDDEDHRSTGSNPTVRSEFLLSQTQERPTKSRRVTASPRVLPKALTAMTSENTGQENNRKDKDTTARRTSSTRWISNEPARDFLKPALMQAEKSSPHNATSTRTNQHAGKTNLQDPSDKREKSNHTVSEKKAITNPYLRKETSNRNDAYNTPKESDFQSRDSLNKETSKLRAKLSNASSRLTHGKSSRKKIPNEWLNDSDDSDKDDEPDFKYTEVVRKKSEREALNGYHCPDCIAFANQVMQGRGAEVFDREELLRCSRHRGRFTPPSSPAGFWELSFADSIRKKKNENTDG